MDNPILIIKYTLIIYLIAAAINYYLFYHSSSKSRLKAKYDEKTERVRDEDLPTWTYQTYVNFIALTPLYNLYSIYKVTCMILNDEKDK